MLEVLTMSGRSVPHAMSMLVPPAWRSDNKIPKTWLIFMSMPSLYL